jgi:hypothetical protein
MISLPMVVRHELVEGAEQATSPEEDQAVETLLADRAHEPFRVGVGAGRPQWRPRNAQSSSSLNVLRSHVSVTMLSGGMGGGTGIATSTTSGARPKV